MLSHSLLARYLRELPPGRWATRSVLALEDGNQVVALLRVDERDREREVLRACGREQPRARLVGTIPCLEVGGSKFGDESLECRVSG